MALVKKPGIVEVVVYHGYGFSFSEQAKQLFREQTGRELQERNYPDRANPILVQIVRDLGKAATRDGSNLSIFWGVEDRWMIVHGAEDIETVELNWETFCDTPFLTPEEKIKLIRKVYVKRNYPIMNLGLDGQIYLHAKNESESEEESGSEESEETSETGEASKE